ARGRAGRARAGASGPPRRVRRAGRGAPHGAPRGNPPERWCSWELSSTTADFLPVGATVRPAVLISAPRGVDLSAPDGTHSLGREPPGDEPAGRDLRCARDDENRRPRAHTPDRELARADTPRSQDQQGT